MTEPFKLNKAVDISGAALGKATSVVIKGLLVLLIIGFFGWSLYVTIVKPHTNPTPTTTQKAEQITNTYYYPNKKVFGLGGVLWGMDIGIVKYAYSDKPVIKQTQITNSTIEDKKPSPVIKKRHWYFLWFF